MNMKYRIENHNLDGTCAEPCHVYDMPPATVRAYHWMGHEQQDEARVTPDYWAAVTDVPCPVCSEGTVQWAEAGYVPGYRICDKCKRPFLASGTIDAPTLIRVGN